MPDSRLVLPFDVEGAILDVLKRRHPEHLAKVERQRGLAPRTYTTFATIVHMTDAAAVRLSGDTLPACLLGVIGAPDFRRNEEDRIDATYQLAMQVTVMGNKRRDTIQRRDIMAWTTVECLLQRLPRDASSLVHSIRLTDYEPLAEVDTQRTVGDARMIFEVGVLNVVDIRGGLPSDTSEWPPDAGGAPDEPYDPVGDLPVATPSFTIERQPLVE